MGSDQTAVQVDVITSGCWYSGSIYNQGFRLAEVLNDGTADILTMHNTVSGIEGCGSASVRWKEVLLRKNRIVMAIPKGSHEAPIRRQNNFLEKNRYGAMIVLPGHILSGVVYLPSRANPLMMLEDNITMPSFIGITEVTIYSSVHEFPEPQLKVAIICRQFIESVQLTPHKLARQPAIATAGGK